ncbi:hypothetical protein [Nocardia sp. CS682]|uniref:hypothetical protein n=1 Tax=Nocardia sp. CS682 TaxID=1047172 RepID=UPI00107576B9|nr:hypothetical protein [Nocardia sp. CS682]QBS43865.1 hypothetical protein DMB37_30985 [Nocardia sp. CS682]
MMPEQITPGVDLWEQYCRDALGADYTVPEPFVIPLTPPIVIPIPESVADRLALTERVNTLDEVQSDTQLVKEFFGLFLSDSDFERFWAAVSTKPPAVLSKLFADLQAAIMPAVPGKGAGDVAGGIEGLSG